MRKPNLFIIGATKCGTTSLHAYLATHPQIFMCEPKEPGFFLDRRERHPAYAKRRSDSEDLAAYLRLFQGAGDAVVMGEASTAYTHAPHRPNVAQRIYAFNPDARLIYMIRDPVVRTISHYWWNVRNEGERRPMLKALRDDRVYTDVSNYAMQLREYYRWFPRAQIKVVLLEELQRQQPAVLGELFDWLGVDQIGDFNAAGAPRNQTPSTVVYSNWPWIDRFRQSRLWDCASWLVPAGVRAAARRLSERSADIKTVDTTEVVVYLRACQRQQTDELEEILGRGFPHWRLLYGDGHDKGCDTSKTHGTAVTTQ